MMTRAWLGNVLVTAAMGLGFVAAGTQDALAQAKVGAASPDFALTDLNGKKVSLSEYKGKTVVLEWFNPECPFVVQAHGKGALKGLADEWTRKGVVWLAINSGAAGKQGTGKDLNLAKAKEYGMAHPILLDEDGKVGKAYGARTTPHVFVVDAKGNLAYAGGLDNAPLGEPEGGKRVPHLENALKELTAGKPVTASETKPYGCSVKYGS